jgi:hypothetical protein
VLSDRALFFQHYSKAYHVQEVHHSHTQMIAIADTTIQNVELHQQQLISRRENDHISEESQYLVFVHLFKKSKQTKSM